MQVIHPGQVGRVRREGPDALGVGEEGGPDPEHRAEEDGHHAQQPARVLEDAPEAAVAQRSVQGQDDGRVSVGEPEG